MKFFSISVFLASILQVGFSIAVLNPEVITAHDSPKFIQCGGTIQSDSGSLTYPEEGQEIVPGEVCVWTIHLDTTEDFRLNFSNFDVASGSSDCTKAGVRIYSLSNLVSSDNQESYVFCDEEPPASTVFLGKTVATVVFYTSEDTLINLQTGFTLNWEGAGYDPLKTKHIATFSTASSAAVQYPVIGGYENNLAATWLIKADTEDSSPVDFNLESLSLDNCRNVEDPCLCDALILYEINPKGLLSERERFCRNVSASIILEEVSSKFILAFFTDLEFQTSSSGGFELIYYPGQTTQEPTTEDPTTEPTTTVAPTTEPPYLISTICGETMSSSFGKISYKANIEYEPFERCIWTIRARDSTYITFNLTKSGIPSGSTFIYISGFRRYSNRVNEADDSMHEEFILKQPTVVTVRGSVAFVVFYSETNSNNLGFELEYYGDQNVDNEYPVSNRSDDYRFIETSGTISYPAITGQSYYSDYELTTFVFPLPNNVQFPSHTLQLAIERASDDVGIEGSCLDNLRLYDIQYYSYGLDFYDRVCKDDIGSSNYTYTDKRPLFLVFLSDESQHFKGFNISWEWVLSPEEKHLGSVNSKRITNLKDTVIY